MGTATCWDLNSWDTSSWDDQSWIGDALGSGVSILVTLTDLTELKTVT